jgi:peptidoglycan/xylan/chitin deacetylase (PgdA/CDA1 family)
VPPPLVSVITIFLNAERFIAEAVQSVLAQTYRNWELILVDDGSSDRSTALARDYARLHDGRILYLEHPEHANAGKSASRNLGIERSRGDLVAFLDADDVYAPRRLEHYVDVAVANPRVPIVFGPTRLWHSWSGNPDEAKIGWDSETELLVDPGVVVAPPRLLEAMLRDEALMPATCSVLIRRDALIEVGGFEPSFRDVYDDFVLWAKLFLRFAAIATDECLDLYRQHSDSSCVAAEQRGEYDPVNPSPSRREVLLWLERHLYSTDTRPPAVLKLVQDELDVYRYPTAPIRIEEMSVFADESDALAGAFVDFPQPGTRSTGRRLPIGGWVVGSNKPAKAVEVTTDGRVIARAAVTRRRPDVGVMFPEAAVATTSGFRASVAIAGTGAATIGLRAVLADQSRVPFAEIRARRWIRAEDDELGTEWVSVVVAAGGQGPQLRATIEAALAQTYPKVEVVVTLCDGERDFDGLVYPRVRVAHASTEATAIRAGIGAARGAYVLRLRPGDRLLPDTIARLIRVAAAAPECPFVAVASPARPLDEASLLELGPIDPPGVVLYQRLSLAAILASAGGGPAQDYDLQLGLARLSPGSCVEGTALSTCATAVPTRAEALAALLATRRNQVNGDERLRTAWQLGMAQRTAARWRRSLNSRGVVLLYHRVCRLDVDPWGITVDPARFADQLEVLRDRFRPTQLSDLCTRVAARRLVDRSVAVTFDDGYLDNLDVAAPTLERAGISATVFLATACIGDEREFWWDALARIFLETAELPPDGRIEMGGKEIAWQLGDDAVLAPGGHYAQWRAWNASTTLRHAAYQRLYSVLQTAIERDRAAALAELHTWSGVPSRARSTHRTLTRAEASRLATSPAIELGAHTVTHPTLSRLHPLEQVEEMRTSKETVEEITGTEVTHFSYPYGGTSDYSPRTGEFLRSMGFTCACAAFEQPVTFATSLMEVPRLSVGDWSAEELESKLEELVAR